MSDVINAAYIGAIATVLVGLLALFGVYIQASYPVQATQSAETERARLDLTSQLQPAGTGSASLVSSTVSPSETPSFVPSPEPTLILVSPGAGASDDYYASVSPDGGEIAFVRDHDGSFDLFVMDWTGANAHPLFETPDIKEGMPFYSPDGNWLIYGGVDATGNEDIYAYNRNTFVHTNLTNTPDVSEGHARFAMSLASEAMAVVFTSDQDNENFDVFRTSFRDGVLGDFEQIVDSPNSTDRVPSFSPQGDRIVFRSASVESGIATSQISSYWLQDGRLTHLTNQSANWYPSFSPDGRWIVVHSERDRLDDNSINREIYLLDAATGVAARRLTTDPGDDVFPAFSPDGAWVLFSSNRSGNYLIYRVAVGDLSR